MGLMTLFELFSFDRISLVNESIVNYFLSDLQIEEHFRALRRYLCMADGDFAEILCDHLMDKVQYFIQLV